MRLRDCVLKFVCDCESGLWGEEELTRVTDLSIDKIDMRDQQERRETLSNRTFQFHSLNH